MTTKKESTETIRTKVIGLYQQVQNIPYGFSLPRDPALLIQKNTGICSEKNMYLAKQFHDWGIPSKFVLIKFDWNSTPVPKDLIAIKKSPIDLHLAIKIKLDNQWMFVDSSWDPALERAGFTVPRGWDGESSTSLAVSPLRKVTVPFLAYWPFKMLLRLREKSEPRFQAALNQYLQEIRAAINNLTASKRK